MARKTIFDDVFRTMCQRMPHLLIPLINEAFDTNYSEDTAVKQLRNEHFERNGEIITDALLEIEYHTYHIECQSGDNENMVIRMVEYDFSIALENVHMDTQGNFIMNFPESCVVYLRKSNSDSRDAVVNIRLPDGTMIPYKMNTICVQDYTQDAILRKRLLMFLPFYILRYEKEIPTAKKKDRDKLDNMLKEFNEMFDKLSELYDEKNSGEYTDLYNLAMKIIRHVVKSEAVKRRFASMGGKVLTLESERIRAEGHAEGLLNGGNLMIYALVQDGDISPEKGAQRLNVTVEELQSRMILTGYKWPEKQ